MTFFPGRSQILHGRNAPGNPGQMEANRPEPAAGYSGGDMHRRYHFTRWSQYLLPISPWNIHVLSAAAGILCLLTGGMAESALFFQKVQCPPPATAYYFLNSNGCPVPPAPAPEGPAWSKIKSISRGIRPDSWQTAACLPGPSLLLPQPARHLPLDPEEPPRLPPPSSSHHLSRAPPAF